MLYDRYVSEDMNAGDCFTMINNLDSKKDSFIKRYVTKIAVNIVGIFFSVILAGVVPRSLGAKNYGDYSFLTNIFSQFVNFLDMRTSTCLYVKLSQEQKNFQIIKFYSFLSVLIIIIMFVGTWIITSNQILLDNLLPFQQARYIYIAVIFAVMTFIQQQFAKIMDALGLTVFSEEINLFLRLSSLLLVIVFFKIKALDLSLYFYINIATSLLFVLIIFFVLRKKISFFPTTDFIVIKKYAKIFYTYCTPLVVYVVIGFTSEYVDRWILQKYGGSIQQGFYAFAFNISNASMIMVSTIFLLFTREVSASVGQNDIKAIAKLFNTYVPILYVLVSFFSCFLFFHADNVIKLLGGKDYNGASLVLKVLSMYPLVSTFSMMSGSVIYATERTVIFRNISFVLAPIGVFVSAILISPIAGINLGAAGLGIKNISLEFIAIVVILFLNSRYLKISFKKYFFHIIYIPIIALVCAGVSTYFVNMSIASRSNALMSVIASGIIYSAIFMTIIYFYPKLIFKEKYEVIDFLMALRSKLQKSGSAA